MDGKQKYCQECGGVIEVKIDGKVIDPKEWMKYSMAVDIGCICRTPRRKLR